MSASKCGQRAVNRGEIGLQTDHASLKSSPSEIECINSRCGGCYADLPYRLLQAGADAPKLVSRQFRRPAKRNTLKRTRE